MDKYIDPFTYIMGSPEAPVKAPKVLPSRPCRMPGCPNPALTRKHCCEEHKDSRIRCGFPGCPNLATNAGKGLLRKFCVWHHKHPGRPKYFIGCPCKAPGCQGKVTVWHGRCYACLCEAHYHEEHDKVLEARRERHRKPRSCSVCNVAVPKGCKFCPVHRRERDRAADKLRAKRLRAQPCWLCLWQEATCDTHRIKPGEHGGSYSRDNVAVICPCCHRVAHEDPDAFFSKVCRALLLDKPIGRHFRRLVDNLAWYAENLPC